MKFFQVLIHSLVSSRQVDASIPIVTAGKSINALQPVNFPLINFVPVRELINCDFYNQNITCIPVCVNK